MDFDEYQMKIREFDFFQETEDYSSVAFLEKVLGLSGEAGEVSDKIKKIIRDKNGVVDEKDGREIAKELGDTLWYLASIARYIGYDLSEIADMNVRKLSDRKNRGKLHGEGDNR